MLIIDGVLMLTILTNLTQLMQIATVHNIMIILLRTRLVVKNIYYI